MRLALQVEQSVAKTEGTQAKATKEPKALACYGLDVQVRGEDGSVERKVWLRFVDGRPVSEATCQYLEWCCGKLEALEKSALLLVWDERAQRRAPWHTSRMVREWIGKHNKKVKAQGKGVRIVVCLLPKKSPWLNPLEPKWVHTKRKVVEPDGQLSPKELADRVCAALGCDHEPHLSIPEQAA